MYYGAPADQVYVAYAPQASHTHDRAGVPGDDVRSLDVFYDALGAYGSWEHDPDLGYVFAPYDNYEPYANGYWAETEYGMTWVSDGDPIGWAVSHYGRWLYADGWRWLPDTTWGPAWVEWRAGNGFIGWAPLGVGRYHVPDDHWRFVATPSVYQRQLRRHLQPRRTVARVFPHTRTVTLWVRTASGRRYIAGPDYHAARRVRPLRRPLNELPLRTVGRDAATSRTRARAQVHAATRTPVPRANRARAVRMRRAAPASVPRRVYRRGVRRATNVPRKARPKAKRRGTKAKRYVPRRVPRTVKPRRSPAPR